MSSTLDSAVVELDGVRTADGQRSCRVVFRGLRSVEVDGAPSGDLRMEAEDGELLSFDEEQGATTLVVEWNDFSARRSTTIVYRIEAERTDVAVT